MSRCRACNVILNNEEQSLVYEFGGTIELCTDCLKESEIGVSILEDDLYTNLDYYEVD